jgi:hypothetical protein
MMRDLLPSIARVVMLGNTPNRYIDLAMERTGRAAVAAGLDFNPVKIASANVLGLGLDEVRRAHPDAVLVAAAPAFFLDAFWLRCGAGSATARTLPAGQRRGYTEPQHVGLACRATGVEPDFARLSNLRLPSSL